MNSKIIYTDDLPDGTGGICIYPWFPMFGKCTIKIRKKYIDDMGILKHELKYKEQYENIFFHALKYKLSRKYRYKCELEAYAE